MLSEWTELRLTGPTAPITFEDLESSGERSKVTFEDLKFHDRSEVARYAGHLCISQRLPYETSFKVCFVFLSNKKDSDFTRGLDNQGDDCERLLAYTTTQMKTAFWDLVSDGGVGQYNKHLLKRYHLNEKALVERGLEDTWRFPWENGVLVICLMRDSPLSLVSSKIPRR